MNHISFSISATTGTLHAKWHERGLHMNSWKPCVQREPTGRVPIVIVIQNTKRNRQETQREKKRDERAPRETYEKGEPETLPCVLTNLIHVCCQNERVSCDTRAFLTAHIRERFECTHSIVFQRKNKEKKQHPKTHSHHPDQQGTAQYNHNNTRNPTKNTQAHGTHITHYGLDE